MTALLYVSAIGATVGIDLSALDRDDAEAVRAVWADAAAEAVDVPAAIVIPRPSDRARMLQSLSRQVTHAAIDARRADLWMLHAAGIATPQGDVVVFVGPSGRGKTTASRHLGQHYGYVSDETIGITSEGRVLAYRKPLSIIEEPRKPKTERGPSSVGLRAIPPDLRVRAIILLHRHPEHVGAPVVSPVDLGDALEDLVTQSSHLVERSDSLRFIAAIAGATGGISAVRYRDASELRSIVPALLERPVSSPVVAPPSARQAVSTRSGTDEPRFFRATSVDELDLATSGRVAVLTRQGGGRGTLHVLDGIAPTLWAAASGVPFGALVAAVTDAHGAPEGGDAADLVRASVDRLVAEGLLCTAPAAPK